MHKRLEFLRMTGFTFLFANILRIRRMVEIDFFRNSILCLLNCRRIATSSQKQQR